MFKDSYNAKADAGDPDPYQGGATVIAPVHPQSFTICQLTEADIPAFLALQATVLESLPDDQKHFLKARTESDLNDHLKAGMPLIGIKTGSGQLVGQALMSFPDNAAAKNLDGYPVHGIEGKAAIVQSVAIHPGFRGKEFGLAAKIHAQIIDTVQAHERSVLMAKVAESNVKSRSSFLANDFEVAATGADPAKGYKVHYFAKDVSKDALMHGAAIGALAFK